MRQQSTSTTERPEMNYTSSSTLSTTVRCPDGSDGSGHGSGGAGGAIATLALTGAAAEASKALVLQFWEDLLHRRF